MDRVFEQANDINDRWSELNAKFKVTLQKIEKDNVRDILREIYKESDIIRNDFANLITLGENGAWRFFAESNGVDVPD